MNVCSPLSSDVQSAGAA